MAAAAAKAAGAPATLWEVSEDGSVELNDVLELQEYAGAGLEDNCTVVRAHVTSEFLYCILSWSIFAYDLFFLSAFASSQF